MKKTNIFNYVFILSLIFTSCNKDINDDFEAINESLNKDLLEATLKAEQTMIEGDIVEKSFLGSKIKVTSLGDGTYALGDMIFEEENFDTEDNQKGVVKNGVNFWPNRTILYRHSSSMSASAVSKIEKAAQYINNNTNLNVRKWTTSDPEGYVWISSIESRGCSAQVGYLAKRYPGQKMNIASGCNVGTTIHEFLHVAGVMHEQTHWNRDNYVNVYYSRITDSYEHNWNKITSGWDMSLAIDFNSIMMYGSYYFQTAYARSNGLPTMTKKDGSIIVPNRSYMSTNDKRLVNHMYR
ncbi:M12 family metallopeptidase [uncultured Polaribacter sp.]|uniref:M12 family metallopeptidase n=1 Tax=uncultured Polaribacter sp. TaxID=174711 RepID=UPI002613C543|nr:M12 family metallopeptidase [uncultured Polaribacter sp.]